GRDADPRRGRGLDLGLDAAGPRLPEVHVRPLEGREVHDLVRDLVAIGVVEVRGLDPESFGKEPLLDPDVERRALLGPQVRVALGEEIDAEGLEERRLLDALPRARLEGRWVVARDRAEGDGRARHGFRAEAVVPLHAAARGDEEAVADREAVL